MTGLVACHFNPSGYSRPVANLAPFLRWVATLGVPCSFAEIAYGCQPFVWRRAIAENAPGIDAVVTEINAGPEAVLFQKEPLWNLAASKLPDQCNHVVCMDADVTVDGGRTWLEGVERALAEALIIQPFHRATWLEADGSAGISKMSTGYAWRHGYAQWNQTAIFHPGFALAADRRIFPELGGFPCCIAGAGDAAICLSVTNQRTHPFFAMPDACARPLLVWGDKVRCWRKDRRPQRAFGYATGDVVHHWHGDLKNRHYLARRDLLTNHEPSDLEVAPDGHVRWTEKCMREKPAMVSAVAGYFASRREDG